MCRLTKTCAFLILAGLMCCIQAGESRAFSQTKITEVRISEDLRRVIIKANGPLDPIQSGRLEGPSLLAIQVPDVSLGDVDHTISNPDNGALFVRVAPSHSGVQILLDFGKAAVPRYRLRLMDDCLIVFLGPPGTHAADSEPPAFSAAAGAAGSQRPYSPAPPRHVGQSATNGRADLSVCSAEVIKGKVVVHVASKKHPGRMYRIDLGLNLDDLGFQSASIVRTRERSRHPRRARGAKPRTVAAAGPEMNHSGSPAAASLRDNRSTKPAPRRLPGLWPAQGPSRMSLHSRRGAQPRFEPRESLAAKEPRYQEASRIAQQ